MKIKDLPKNIELKNIKFYLPSGEAVYLVSQWSYPDGKAGIWCKKNILSGRVFPFPMDSLNEMLEFEVATE